MGEWEFGLVWVLVALLAAARLRPADTDAAPATDEPATERPTDERSARRPVRSGWPPGLRLMSWTGPPGRRPELRPALPFTPMC